MVGEGLIYGHKWNILAFLFIYLPTLIYSCLQHSAVTRVQLLGLVEAGSKWPSFGLRFLYILLNLFLGRCKYISYITSNKSATFMYGRPGMEMTIFGLCDIIYSWNSISNPTKVQLLGLVDLGWRWLYFSLISYILKILYHIQQDHNFKCGQSGFEIAIIGLLFL